MPGRRAYAALALAAALFIAYGSLVPFVFEPITWAEALTRFGQALSWPPFIDSRTDFVTNILIAVPLGYFAMAAVGTDRPRRIAIPRSVVVLPACLAVALIVEFAQVFFPIRTDSLSDILAQGVGALVGVVGWLVVGESVTGWTRDSLAEREAPALIQRLLLVYVVLFVVSQMMPLDLTLNLGQLARKYRNGGVLVVPFQYEYATRMEQAWDLLGASILSVPLGAAAVLLGTRRGHRRRAVKALGLVILAVGMIECAQILVISRVADTTDFIFGAAGAITGVAVTAALSGRKSVAVPQSRTAVFAWDAVFLWTCALISYHWSPFNFSVSPSRVILAVQLLLEVPFHSYYVGDQFHAFNEILRKSMLAVPLGTALVFALPGQGYRLRYRVLAGWAVSASILLAIEVGQIFIPSRIPDITDPLVGSAGALVAFLLTDRLRGLTWNRGVSLEDRAPLNEGS